jgi:hypothetical protein
MKPFAALLLPCLLLVTAVPAVAAPGHCEIEIVNGSHEAVTVHVTFEDRHSVSFVMHQHDAPHYVNLFWGGYCHRDAHVVVTDAHRRPLYSSFTKVDAIIHIVPY